MQISKIMAFEIVTQLCLVNGKGFGDALKSSFSKKPSNEGFHMSAAQVMFIERMESLRQKYAKMVNTEFDLSTYEMHEHKQYGMLEHNRRKRSPKSGNGRNKTKSVRFGAFKKYHRSN